MLAEHSNHESDWKDGFLFVGNHLALDFLNTRPVQNGEPRELLPDFGALLRWCQAAGLLGTRDAEKLEQQWGDSARGGRTWEAALELREKLRKQVRDWEDGGTVRQSFVAELNQLMAKHPMLSRLKEERGGLSIELWFRPVQPENLLAPLAQNAAKLFAAVDHNRVRQCGECVLHFYDTSKKGTRRWCSMRLCGNRIKVAAYAARQRRPRSTAVTKEARR
jgi:predicted RNA-binding Zn ribbon-like protein